MKRLLTVAALAVLVLWPSLAGSVQFRSVPYVFISASADTLFADSTKIGGTTTTGSTGADSLWTSEIILIQDRACSFHFGNMTPDSTSNGADSITFIIEKSWDGVTWEQHHIEELTDWTTAATQFSETSDLDEITNTTTETIPAPIARYARLKITNLSAQDTTPDTLVKWFAAVLAVR